MSAKRKKSHMNYTDPVGIWKVTTEGDCEGKTTRQLGTFKGHIADIAKGLATRCYYSLKFEPVENLDPPEQNEEIKTVSILLDIGSNTWDMTSEKRVAFVQKLLGDKAIVKKSDHYAAILLDFRQPSQRRLTNEQYLNNVGLRCPYCESKNLVATAKAKPIEKPEGRKIFQPVQCDDCGSEWEEEYTLAGFKEK